VRFYAPDATFSLDTPPELTQYSYVLIPGINVFFTHRSIGVQGVPSSEQSRRVQASSVSQA
jgi:hypothetical protein